VKGAFTSADRSRAGLIAQAEGGTLLLDEIGELPLTRQATLLRALETRKYRQVGTDSERRFDVRIVAATNRDLEAAVRAGTFRSDLLYRLNVLVVRVPSLREREGDVAVLARHFLTLAGSNAEIAPAALQALEQYGWPGNVRELEHQIQRLCAAGVRRIERKHLSRTIRGAEPRGRARPRPAPPRPAPPPSSPEQQRQQVSEALTATDGNITQAAARLGLTRHGLKKRMLRLGMREGAGHAKSSAR
jgi:two-component system NtrC family response regulator